MHGYNRCMIIYTLFLPLYSALSLPLPRIGGLNSQSEKERWKRLKQTVINVMCREARSKKRI